MWLDFNIAGSLWRYFKRSINKNEHRPGNLEGATIQFSWKLIHYMIFIAPKKKDKYRVLIKEGNVKLLHLTTFHSLKDYYTKWELVKMVK
ncbi:hypothetical protein SAMN05216436_106217 [bacterium A37T11]|nr:hypothetical protein SAMN05216436_106217 [bacterium A37T11]